MDWQRERLRKALRDRGQKMSAASKAIGRNHAYVSQFLENQTPKELSEKDRVGLEKFLLLPDGWLRNPQSPLSAKPPRPTRSQNGNDSLTAPSQAKDTDKKAEEGMNALIVALERLLDQYDYKIVSRKLDELEAERRARPQQRQRA